MISCLMCNILLCLRVALILTLDSEKVKLEGLDSRHSQKKQLKEDRSVLQFKNSRGYKYFVGLQTSLEKQLRLCDELEDLSCRIWSIRASIPDKVKNGTAVFHRSRQFEATPFTSECNVSHVEFMLPIENKTREWQENIIIRREEFSPNKPFTPGIAMFNLTNVNFRAEKRISILVKSGHLLHLHQSALFTFCSMNSTILRRIQVASYKVFGLPKIEVAMADDPTSSLSANDKNMTGTKKSKSKRQEHAYCPQVLFQGKLNIKNVSASSAPQRVDYKPRNDACKRHKLFIALQFYPEAFLVLHPDYVDAGHCKGMCIHVNDFCRVDDMRTGHAVLMNRNRENKLTSYVNCAPHKLASISIMYFWNEIFETFVLPNAVVKTCRCA